MSPRLHNAACGALGLDWVYARVRGPEGDAAAALDAARVLDLVGLSVTMPHKTAIAACCDDLSPAAAALRSVNTVTFSPEGHAAGDSTDGPGFLRSLADADVAVADQAVLRARRAAALHARSAYALAGRGAHVTVAHAAHVGRDRGRRPRRAATPSPGKTVRTRRRDGGHHRERNTDRHGGRRRAPLPIDAVNDGARAGRPRLRAARDPAHHRGSSRRRSLVSGIGMLVHQATLQVEMWSGRDAPIDAMRAAL